MNYKYTPAYKEVIINGAKTYLILDYYNDLLSITTELPSDVNFKNINIDFFDKTLYVDIIPTYACNISCEYCYAKDTRNIPNGNMNIEKIINTILTICEKEKFDKIYLGFIGGGEPLLKWEESLLLIHKLSDIFCDKIQLIRFVTNGLLLSTQKLSEYYNNFNQYKISLNITVNYINISKIDVTLMTINNFLKEYKVIKPEIIFQLYIYKKGKNAYFQFFEKVKNYVRVIDKIILKPAVYNNKINNKLFIDIFKIYQKYYSDFTFKDFLYPCVNLRSNNYIAIDYRGKSYRCHAQSGRDNSFFVNNPSNDYSNICTECNYFSICLGGCYPFGFPNIKSKEECIYYKHIDSIVEFLIKKIIYNKV